MANAPKLEAPLSLGKPGVGLPRLENLVARYWIMPRLSRRMSWEDVDALLERESERVLKVHANFSDTAKTQPVLVERLKGLEDSSRFWSPNMVLEHLVIVGQQMLVAIVELGNGRIPNGKADVAAVKPKGIDGVLVAQQFESFYPRCRKTLPFMAGI